MDFLGYPPQTVKTIMTTKIKTVKAAKAAKTTPPASTDNMTSQTAPNTAPYAEVQILDRDLHRELAYPSTPGDFSFAAALNIIPLLVQELPLAVHHYPIVFLIGDGAPMPVAL